MPYGDVKYRKVRGRSWTQADERRQRAEERRQLKADEQARLQRERELAKMAKDGTLELYLETERLKKQAEDEKATQLVLERRELTERIQLDKSADARLMAGGLRSEFATAIGWRERFGQFEGDWLDDPVEAMISGHGFGEEVRTSRGIKMQVNLCLDCSNSMEHNGISSLAQDAVKDMYLGLRMAATELPTGSLAVDVWTWARSDDGKYVEHVTYKDAVAQTIDNPLGPLGRYWAQFDGEDTWISPLLEKLEKYENRYGDSGAYRLDIIVTDGVLEHVTDARKGDEIQERRDGTLQTILLNFLPIEEWAECRVPKRCVQYPATPDNLVSLMHGVLGSWLVSM